MIKKILNLKKIFKTYLKLLKTNQVPREILFYKISKMGFQFYFIFLFLIEKWNQDILNLDKTYN